MERRTSCATPYVNALRGVRRLLEEAGDRPLTRRELNAHRADLLVLRQRTRELGVSGGPLAHLFELSPALNEAFEQVAREEATPSGPPHGHGHGSRQPHGV